ncbi:MAG: RidA family protein [Nanoarchaeota archaeon]
MDEIQRIITENAPKPGNYSQGIKVDIGPGWMVYVSGQTGNVVTGQQGVISDSIIEQTRQALKNIEAIIIESEGDRKNIVDMTVFLKDLKAKPDFEIAYSQFFHGQRYPARSLVEVSDIPLRGEGCLVELKAIAYIPK